MQDWCYLRQGIYTRHIIYFRQRLQPILQRRLQNIQGTKLRRIFLRCRGGEGNGEFSLFWFVFFFLVIFIQIIMVKVSDTAKQSFT